MFGIAALTTAMFGISLPTIALAQQSGATAVSQIVTIERQRLFSETAYGQRVIATIEAERARLAQKTREVEASLAEEELLLTEQRSSLDPTAFRILADSFDKKVNELRAEGVQREQEFVSVLEREQSAFFERIGPILGRLVRELGAVVILDRRAILLATQNIDITDMAIRRIDLELGDGVTTPAAPSNSPSEEEQPDVSGDPVDSSASEDANNN
jgi:Skp family chaperone for outer membrane proteins